MIPANPTRILPLWSAKHVRVTLGRMHIIFLWYSALARCEATLDEAHARGAGDVPSGDDHAISTDSMRPAGDSQRVLCPSIGQTTTLVIIRSQGCGVSGLS